jgi:hypothetical protein
VSCAEATAALGGVAGFEGEAADFVPTLNVLPHDWQVSLPGSSGGCTSTPPHLAQGGIFAMVCLAG